MTEEVLLTRRATLYSALAGIGAVAVASSSASAQDAAARPLSGKVAIVTGARNNQGRAYAVELARMGADLVLHYHRAETLAEVEETAALVQAEGVRTALVSGDLGDPAVARAVFDLADSTYGGADILVHTAGAIIKKPVAEFADEEFEKLLNDNTRTTFYTMREAARRLRDGGRIVAIGTSLTAGAAPGYAVYAGTKAPVEEFSRMMARELGARGITVNNIAPGPLDNPFFHSAETPESTEFATRLAPSGRLGTEADIVPVVATLTGPEGAWINGQTLFVNGGYLTR
ncbi:SDR family oxidoreductase [Tabrizicola sp.]|uniref:SDR family oxidoreductase n=1 Tax=Tabrizicola sp. TaxID=2005166 RepID=UPI003F2D8DE4